MDIRELTDEMDRFVSAKGWYQPGTPRPQTPRNLAISLSLESAEILAHFQWRDETSDRQGLSEELAGPMLLPGITGLVPGVAIPLFPCPA